MIRILFTVVALALALTLVQPVSAQWRGKRGGFRGRTFRHPLRKPTIRKPVTRKPGYRKPIVHKPIRKPFGKVVKKPTRGKFFNPLPIQVKNYRFKHGTRFKYFHRGKYQLGYRYRGRRHYHWKYYCWSQVYGCKCYWCPSCRAWFYYYPAHRTYYPISYIKRARPPRVPLPVAAPTAPTAFTPEALPAAP